MSVYDLVFRVEQIFVGFKSVNHKFTFCAILNPFTTVCLRSPCKTFLLFRGFVLKVLITILFEKDFQVVPKRCYGAGESIELKLNIQKREPFKAFNFRTVFISARLVNPTFDCQQRTGMFAGINFLYSHYLYKDTIKY
jgi:hypothetical protein